MFISHSNEFLFSPCITGVIMLGGSEVCAYLPDVGVQETLRENGDESIWKIRYSNERHPCYPYHS